jgi:putative IMPACT (imprinted ancient) family translation regulator
LKVDAVNGPESYRTLSSEGSFEFTEKKSRFIGFAAPALLEEDALQYIESVKARHPQCSAVLYAYLSGFQGTQQRFFDAHEPSGGLMMLEALKRQQVTGAVTAVVRYYGGIQLGAGPLGRAFGRAAAEAIAQAQPCMVEHTTLYEVCFDYTLSGKLEHWFEHSPHRMQGLEYGEQVKSRALVRATQKGRFLADMADMTAGQAKPQALSECYLRWE